LGKALRYSQESQFLLLTQEKLTSGRCRRYNDQFSAFSLKNEAHRSTLKMSRHNDGKLFDNEPAPECNALFSLCG
jgi:hypothetical protein